MSPELSIIITSYRSPELLRLCISSIKKNVKGVEYEIIVVDSSTQEETRDLFKEERFKEVIFIANKKNRGFGGLVNRGLKKAKGKFYFIINTDIIIKDDAVNKLLEFIKKENGIGVVSPKLINFDNSVQQSCFGFYSPLTVLYRRTFLGRMAFAKKHLNIFQMKKQQETKKPFDVDWVMGSAMMTSRESVKRVGPYDQRYFMYFEDVDWCRMFWKNNYRVIYNPKIKVYHYHGKASASRNAFFSVLTNRYTRAHIASSFKYFIKYVGEKNPHEEFNKKGK